MDAFVGIDLAFAKNKRLPVCLATWRDGRLVPLPLAGKEVPAPPRGSGNIATLDPDAVGQFAEATANYLYDLQEHFGVTIRRIAIDAPSDAKRPGAGRRQAEVALDHRRISCFTTPSADGFEAIKTRARAHLDAGGEASRLPHANQLWMLVGFELFRLLRADWECLEVFPQATAVALGASAVHKRTALGVEAQLRAASRFTGWPNPCDLRALRSAVPCPAHDALDAYLSAWVAALEPDRRIGLGEPPGDVIWVPNIGLLAELDARTTSVG